MKDLTAENADRIIAEFMDLVEDKQYLKKTIYMTNNGIEPDEIIIYKGGALNPPEYSKSLDLLVPVWEKLDCNPEFYLNWGEELSCYLSKSNRQSDCWVDSDWSTGTTIQQASAIATAKAILSLRSNDEADASGGKHE